MRSGRWMLGRRRALLLALLALLSLTLLSCQPGRTEAPPRPAPDFPLQLRKGGAADYRAALHAVYTEVVAERPDEALPRDVGDRLQRAAKVLRTRAKTSRSAELTRRITIVRLTTQDLKIVREASGPRPILKYAEDFLVPVGAPMRAIERHIIDTIDEIDARPLSLTPTELIELLIEILGNTLFEVLDVSLAPDPCGFPFKDLHTKTHPNTANAPDGCSRPDDTWKDGLVWVEASFKIQRPLPELAELLDPQTWDDVGDCSPWFEETCIVNPAEGGSCDACLHEAGSDWNQQLYEWFFWSEWPLGQSGSTTETSFTNYLDIDSDYFDLIHPHHYQMDYCLDRTVSARIGSNTSGKIATDQGFTLVSEAKDETQPGWYEVEVHKMIKFEDWVDLVTGDPIDYAVNFNANVVLQGLGDGTLNLACCALPSDPECTP